MHRTYSSSNRLRPSPIARHAVVMLIALLALTWSSRAFCDEIHDAAGRGDLAKVKTLLKGKPGLVSSKNDYGQTPLHYAAHGHKDVAELLLIDKAEVDAKDKAGYTPLYVAAQEGHKDVVELLLAYKADVNAKANNGDTPLDMAVYKGRRDVVDVLLANNADVNAKDNKGGFTPLHFAAGMGHKDLVELLLAYKADVNAKDNNGHTPLAWALHKGHKDVAEVLRQHGGHE